MKNVTSCFLMAVFLFACKSTSYHYLTPTINAAMYSRAGEGMGGIQFGSAGLAAKAGIALTNNINLNGWASFFPESDNGYNSREFEFSLGFQTNPRSNKVTSFFIGVGNGDNEKDKIGLAGSYNRPFLQIQHGAFDKSIFRSKAAWFDSYFGLRLNYLIYNGKLATADFDDELVYYEPYFGAAIGGKNVRLEIVQGFSIKNSDWEKGVRVIPYWANIGLTVKFRKKH